MHQCHTLTLTLTLTIMEGRRCRLPCRTCSRINPPLPPKTLAFTLTLIDFRGGSLQAQAQAAARIVERNGGLASLIYDAV